MTYKCMVCKSEISTEVLMCPRCGFSHLPTTDDSPEFEKRERERANKYFRENFLNISAGVVAGNFEVDDALENVKALGDSEVTLAYFTGNEPENCIYWYPEEFDLVGMREQEAMALKLFVRRGEDTVYFDESLPFPADRRARAGASLNASGLLTFYVGRKDRYVCSRPINVLEAFLKP